ncbi:hypothetical protein PanWU01x14_291370 [Parasponia andersonii]|uniref:Uncharacterized protein n=1 Tax=Parasponia andersonii TaxID=3476 RepID=A0A2P5AX98_PARAD|nr:hypothetical protein PanWU01x14_291370 [Parasponia andersonii]
MAKEKRSEQGTAKVGTSWVPPSRPPSLTTWAVLSTCLSLIAPRALPGGSQSPPLPWPSPTFTPYL